MLETGTKAVVSIWAKESVVRWWRKQYPKQEQSQLTLMFFAKSAVYRMTTINFYEAQFLDVLRSAGLALILRGVGAGLAFLLTVAIARILGAEETGVYFMALSVVSIGAVISKLGLDSALLRFIATGVSRKDWNSVIGVFSLGMRMASVASALSASIIYFAAENIAINLFDEPRLTGTLRTISFGLFPFAVMMLIGECLKGLKLIGNAMLVSSILYPMASLVFIWPLGTIMGATGAALAFVAGTTFSATIGLWMWKLNTSRELRGDPSFSLSTLWNSSRHLWFSNLVTGVILPWLPLFLLGIWGNSSDVGIFGAASRVSMLVTLLLVAANTALAPKIAELYENKDFARIKRLSILFVVVVPAIASPLLMLLIFRAEIVMEVFGNDFAQGGQSLRVMAIGHAVVCISGIGGQIIMMTGHLKHMRNGSILSVSVLTLTSMTLIPIFGALGAAFSSAMSMSTINVYLAIVAIIKLRTKTL